MPEHKKTIFSCQPWFAELKGCRLLLKICVHKGNVQEIWIEKAQEQNGIVLILNCLATKYVEVQAHQRITTWIRLRLCNSYFNKIRMLVQKVSFCVWELWVPGKFISFSFEMKPSKCLFKKLSHTLFAWGYLKLAFWNTWYTLFIQTKEGNKSYTKCSVWDFNKNTTCDAAHTKDVHVVVIKIYIYYHNQMMHHKTML